MRVKKRYKNKKKRLLFLVTILFICILIIFSSYYLLNKESNVKEDNQNDENNEKIEEVINLKTAPVSAVEYENFEDGEYVTKNGYNLLIIDGIAYIDGIMIANKTYSLPNNYEPKYPYSGNVDSMSCIECIDKTTMESFKEMQADAKALGLNIYIQSGYRSYARQEVLFNNYKSRDGEEAADTYSSRPGHSEHQTGLCFDLNSIDDSFTNTDEGKWVNENAYLYGFVIRFPKGKEEYTGYIYESWHLRYVGKEIAKKLYNNGNWLSIEEYYGITSQYK